MKQTDGLFHDIFEKIAADYSDIENEHWIVDIGAAKMSDTPENFDVIVVPNLYGDILSDISAQIAGSVGLAGSANIGSDYAMFEAIHGSAPRRAGQNMANPSGLLMGAVMMLVHIGQAEAAERVHNAWLRTLEKGIHTYDIYSDTHSKEKVGTQEFAQAVINHLGELPETLPQVTYQTAKQAMDLSPRASVIPEKKRELTGVDVFVCWPEQDVEKLASILGPSAGEKFTLKMITNRGIKVWPEGLPETFCTDHWRCRFMGEPGSVEHDDIIVLLQKIKESGLEFIKIENLYIFDGERGFSA